MPPNPRDGHRLVNGRVTLKGVREVAADALAALPEFHGRPKYRDDLAAIIVAKLAHFKLLAADVEAPAPAPAPTAKEPCPEGFHWIGQPLSSCDQCGLPAWDHAGYASLPERLPSPFGKVAWVLKPWEPGEAEAIKAKWSRS